MQLHTKDRHSSVMIKTLHNPPEDVVVTYFNVLSKYDITPKINK